jgi:tRNA uridine 5-carbamoylmethylation protein Kti12
VDDRIAKRIAGRLNGLAHQQWCVLLAGLPGSGKTTFRKQLIAALDCDPIVVSTDDIILDLAQRQGKTYQAAFEALYGSDLGREAFAQAKIARENLRPLIIDQVNPSVKSRRKKLAWLSKNYMRVGVYCAVDRDTAVERITRRGAYGASMRVHDSMREIFVEPTADEFDEFYTIEPTSWLVAQ